MKGKIIFVNIFSCFYIETLFIMHNHILKLNKIFNLVVLEISTNVALVIYATFNFVLSQNQHNCLIIIIAILSTKVKSILVFYA